MNLTRAIVCQHVGPLKTAASQKPVPMDAGLSTLLLDWRGRCPYNQERDYVFASLAKDGAQPLWPSSAMSNHIRPAAKLARNPKARSLARIQTLIRNASERER
jgi:hypothetical protein